jgi:hypothetical protein
MQEEDDPFIQNLVHQVQKHEGPDKGRDNVHGVGGMCSVSRFLQQKSMDAIEKPMVRPWLYGALSSSFLGGEGSNTTGSCILGMIVSFQVTKRTFGTLQPMTGECGARCSDMMTYDL